MVYRLCEQFLITKHGPQNGGTMYRYTCTVKFFTSKNNLKKNHSSIQVIKRQKTAEIFIISICFRIRGEESTHAYVCDTNFRLLIHYRRSMALTNEERQRRWRQKFINPEEREKYIQPKRKMVREEGQRDYISQGN